MTALIDPYWRWHKATVNRYTVTLLKKVPFLVEFATPAQAVSFATANPDWVPGLVTTSQFQVIQLALESFDQADALFGPYAVRYECGAPFVSPDNKEREWLQYLAFLSTVKPVLASKPVVGFIDFGCAFAHGQFKQYDKTGQRLDSTRLFALWDQGGSALDMRLASEDFFPLAWRPPMPFGYGAEVRREDDLPNSPIGKLISNQKVPALKFNPTAIIKGALLLDKYVEQFARNGEVDEALCYAKSGYRAAQAPFTHGTHVMDVAVGYPDPALAVNTANGAPPSSDLVFVQLPRFFETAKGKERQVAGLLRTYVLDAVRYIFGCVEPTQPVVINLSYGASAGPHNGDSILEQAIDEAIASRRAAGGSTEVVVAAGNWRKSDLHASVGLKAAPKQSNPTKPSPKAALKWHAPPDTPTTQFVEIWCDWPDKKRATGAQVRVTPPGATRDAKAWITCGTEATDIVFDREPVATLIFIKDVSQSKRGRMALLGIYPTTTEIGLPSAPYGEWIIEVKNTEPHPLVVNAWCERNDPVYGSGSGPRQARFVSKQIKQGTLSSIGHGKHTLVVGGYYPNFVNHPSRVAPDSSEGPGRLCKNSRNAQIANLPGPNLLAPSGMNHAEPGVAAAGMLGEQKIRLTGTSIAAASATRYIAQLQASGQLRASKSKAKAVKPAKATLDLRNVYRLSEGDLTLEK